MVSGERNYRFSSFLPSYSRGEKGGDERGVLRCFIALCAWERLYFFVPSKCHFISSFVSALKYRGFSFLFLFFFPLLAVGFQRSGVIFSPVSRYRINSRCVWEDGDLHQANVRNLLSFAKYYSEPVIRELCVQGCLSPSSPQTIYFLVHLMSKYFIPRSCLEGLGGGKAGALCQV